MFLKVVSLTQWVSLITVLFTVVFLLKMSDLTALIGTLTLHCCMTKFLGLLLSFFLADSQTTKVRFSEHSVVVGFGKVQIKQLCQQYARNVTRDITRSLRDLETEVVDLQGLAESTGNQGLLDSLKLKKSALANLLGVTAQRALVRSRFLDVTQMDAPSHFFFGLEKMDRKKIFHSL